MRKRDLIIDFLQLICWKGKKAAPRFELGIKDLQSSALPLGHAAIEEGDLSLLDSISKPYPALLVVSNGHGEDLISLRLLEALHNLRPNLSLSILPLVGEGQIFLPAISSGWLKKLGPLARLPSGGFSNQSFHALLADFFAGLFVITLKQWCCIRSEVQKGHSVLVVGDLLPLALVWSARARFAFLGTPKSDYTWRSGPGSALSDVYHRFKGSEWDPWEWALMRSSRCQFVAVRDHLTARGLKGHQVKAHCLGNPMMDGFARCLLPDSLKPYRRLILLCGSRMPEAASNFKRLLAALNNHPTIDRMAVFVALGSNPSIPTIKDILQEDGFVESSVSLNGIGASACFFKADWMIFVGSGQFSRWAQWAEVGLATAGTATEQLVGLGIPCISLPGPGPQFKRGFAIRQSRLLGGVVMPCFSNEQFSSRLNLLLRDPQLRERLGNIGFQRMGSIGGSIKLANIALRVLLRDYES